VIPFDVPSGRTLGLYILNDEGDPQLTENLIAWAMWLETTPDRILLQHRIGRGSRVFVSTIFLGVDYAHFGGPPILWETLIRGGPFDGFMDRYRSKLEALRGHARALAVVEVFPMVPRKTKKALRKFGRGYCTLAGLTAGERRRIGRVLRRAAWETGP
jgi:hypothetical protein